MSAFQRMRSAYDRLVLGVGVLLAIMLLGDGALSNARFREQFQTPNSLPQQGLPGIDFREIREATLRQREPVRWVGNHLFGSVPILADGDGRLHTQIESHAPISDHWIKQHGFTEWMGRTGFRESDPDGDRYSNLEEFSAQTDPRDPQDHPERFTKLCVKEEVRSQLELVFRGRVDATTWLVELVEPAREPAQVLLRARGETFGPDGCFRFDDFRERMVFDELGLPQDRSVLSFSYSAPREIERRLGKLVRDQAWEVPSDEVILFDRYDKASYRVGKGASIVLSPEVVYSVEKMDSLGLQLRDREGKKHFIRGCE